MTVCSRRSFQTAIGVAVVAILAGTLLFAPSADAAPTISVQVGFGGRHRGGADMLIQVDIVADQLIDGELRISSNNGPVGATIVLPVEIAGGAQKRFVTVMPAVLQWQGGTSVTLVDGSAVVATQQAQFIPAVEEELVGVLPSLSDAAPASASLAVELVDARIFPISDALLSVGPGTIDALGTVVAAASDLAALGEAARTSLQVWVETGGTLVVDEPPGPIPGFEINADTAPTTVGLGRIMASGGTFASGRWDGVLLPTSFPQDESGSGGLTGELTGEVGWFGGPVANSLASDAGFGLPPMGVVLPLMAGYVLLIGPITWFVLRRAGRRGLLWLVLPGLALAFTALIWAGGDRIRSGTNDAHGTVIRVENGVAFARTTILESGAGGSTASLEIPQNWRPLQTTDFQFGFDNTSNTVIRPGLDTTRIEAPLDAGDLVVLGASGPTPGYDDALTVTAESSSAGVTTGSVTNQLDVALDETVVFIGSQFVEVGTLESGESATFEVSGAEADHRFGPPVDLRVWNDDQNGFGPNGFGPNDDESGSVNLSLWAAFMNANIGRVRQPGTVSVVGWTDALPSPADTSVTSGRTAFLARAPIAATGSVLSDVAGQRALLRGAEQTAFNPNEFRFTVVSAWRFDIPAGIAVDTVGLQLPDNLASVEVWDGGLWRALDDPEPGIYELPAGAFAQGALYVKPTVNFDEQALLGRGFAAVTFEPDTNVFDALLTSDALAEETTP